jgi:hypothetical protein
MRPLLPCSLVLATLTFVFATLSFGCGQGGTSTGSAPSSGSTKLASAFKEGKDYTVLERVRFLDETGFERPAEAFSVLLPKGWKHEGGIIWKGLNECRGEMVGSKWSASSPDGSIRFISLPGHSWTWASDEMMQQTMMMQAQNGGCEVGMPIQAEQYFREVFAPRELQGVTINELKPNPDAVRTMNEKTAQLQNGANAYGGNTTITHSAVTARLTWSDGSEGIALCSVTNMQNVSQDPYSGAMQGTSTSFTPERSFIRYPAAKRAEAEGHLANIQSSIRTNPQWKQAIEGYFAELGRQSAIEHHQRMRAIDDQTRAMTAAHNQRMNDIQAQGAATTNAHNERMANMDNNMRSWEAQQSSQDRSHSAFVQTIREVETYRDGSGTVELSSGYGQAWSRGDGTYILSNSPGFDPSGVFQDQNWQEMKKREP